MRILVTGVHGQVVSALKTLDPSVVALGRPSVDLADVASLSAPIMACSPDVIISAAAYTAVDKAESEPELAQAINAHAPGELAKIASSLGIPILHLSTDYVFDGQKQGRYVEDDKTGPINVYGATKLEGEEAVRLATDDHVILRTAWVYSAYGTNFVKTMLRLAETRDAVNVVADQRGCPTYAIDIAASLLEIASRVTSEKSQALRGTFHLSAPNEASWADFASAIFSNMAARGHKNVDVFPITTESWPTPAKRPANSRLDASKLTSNYGISLPSWQQSLIHCLDALAA